MKSWTVRRSTRSMGQFARGKSAAIEKRREHGGSCRLSDQPSNLGYQRPRNHGGNVAPGTAGPEVSTSTAIEVASRNPGDASTTVEVFTGASDRFEGKITAMMCRPGPACGAWPMALGWAWDAA